MTSATLKRKMEWDTSNPILKRRRDNNVTSPSTNSGGKRASVTGSSPFDAKSFPKLTSEEITANIRDEVQRLRRRKLLIVKRKGQDSDSSGSDSKQGSCQYQENTLFTLTHVGLLCEQLLNAKVAALQEQYEELLTAKLAEQYDTFVRFTYDQIHKRYDASPSYLC